MNLEGQREQQALKEGGSLLKAGPEGVKREKYAAVKQKRSHSSKRAIKSNCFAAYIMRLLAFRVCERLKKKKK